MKSTNISTLSLVYGLVLIYGIVIGGITYYFAKNNKEAKTCISNPMDYNELIINKLKKKKIVF